MVLTEERRQYLKNYRETHKEKKREYNKKYNKENKEERREYDKKYREENKNKYKKYNQTEQRKKSNRITNWKKSGVICDDFNKLYDYYINCCNCEECNIELIEGYYGNNKRCLDHNHETGEFRNILCNTCNIKRGRIDNNKIKLTTAEKSWKYNLKRFILS